MSPIPPHPYLSSGGFHPFLPIFTNYINNEEIITLGKRDLGDAIYLFIGSSPTNLTFSSACGAAIEGLIFGTILVQTTKYLSAFGRSDPVWAVCGIILGAITLLLQFGLNLWQTHRLIENAATQLLTVIVTDLKCNMTVIVIIGIMNFVAAGYFGRRAWLLAKKNNWLLPPLIMGIFTSLGLSLGVAIKGYMLPSLADNPSPENLMKYDSWRKTDNRLIVIWASVALVQDVLVCGLMTAMLLKERDGFRKTEGNLLRLLLRLTYETMAGPVLVNIATVIVVAKQGATFAGYSRIVSWMLGQVYFSAILQSLNYRKDVQRMLKVVPTPRPKSTSNFKGYRKSTLERMESPSIPLTSTDMGTREIGLVGIETQHARNNSQITNTTDEDVFKRNSAGNSSTTATENFKRERPKTIESDAKSNLSTDIVLSGEKQ
ncbi:uncharacterized protein L201_001580 [Kwoniella dendrophila CBS 6074]|uniref:DUF6534 domain-containing protein n=1 Tax=Kwoniella dendrophila CBS 6074 TaxID=1295534 RepID=A0AAX4JP96_9TREE